VKNEVSVIVGYVRAEYRRLGQEPGRGGADGRNHAQRL
jgi:hypothetical protein